MFREQLYRKMLSLKSQRQNKANSLFKLFDLRKEVKRFNFKTNRKLLKKKVCGVLDHQLGLSIGTLRHDPILFKDKQIHAIFITVHCSDFLHFKVCPIPYFCDIQCLYKIYSFKLL